uniref:Phage head-tail connector protein n=1 Tax=uncultured Elusimicrobia bacterium TaxID=699876 RepID=A0A650EMI1_9BACT|nr:phage head-tail connector protein [uncultured Elusimicrobia bacterium]
MIPTEIKRRFDAVREEAKRHWPLWKELRDYLLPTAGSFDEKPNDPVNLDYLKLLDCDPNQFLTWLAAAMMSGMTNPSREWFALGTDKGVWGETPEEAEYLKKRKERIEYRLHKGNVYLTLLKMYYELPAVGTYVFMVEADPVTGIRTVPFTIGETYLGLGASDKIDTFAHTVYMTPGEMAAHFGNAVPAVIRERAQSAAGATERIAVHHLIEPNRNARVGRADGNNMPFRSVWWTGGHDTFLRESGYKRFPVICPRWDVKHYNSVWGFGPGATVLGALKSLQRVTQDEYVAVELGIKPPLQADAGMQGNINLEPGGISFKSQSVSSGLTPVYQAQMDISKAELLVSKVKNMLRSQFFCDVFLMLAQDDKTGRTATEVAQKMREKMMIFGPVLERLNHECYEPLIELVDQINEDNGDYDDLIPPETLQGREIKITFNSIFQEAQKESGTYSMQQLINFAAQLAQIKADALDWLDADKMMKTAAEKLSSVELLAEEETVASLRANRAQEAAKQQQLQDAAASVELAQGVAAAGASAQEMDFRKGM